MNNSLGTHIICFRFRFAFCIADSVPFCVSNSLTFCMSCCFS